MTDRIATFFFLPIPKVGSLELFTRPVITQRVLGPRSLVFSRLGSKPVSRKILYVVGSNRGRAFLLFVEKVMSSA
jgi:hypothetical protein